jgi:hypothetical protein
VYNGESSELKIMTFMKNGQGRREMASHVVTGSEKCVREWENKLLWFVERHHAKSEPTEEEQKKSAPPKRKVLIIQNPFSGNGAAVPALTTAMTMLEHAHLEITIMQTEFAGHAADIVKELAVG